MVQLVQQIIFCSPSLPLPQVSIERPVSSLVESGHCRSHGQRRMIIGAKWAPIRVSAMTTTMTAFLDNSHYDSEKNSKVSKRVSSGQELMLIDLRSPFPCGGSFYDFFTNLQTHTPSQAFYTLPCCRLLLALLLLLTGSLWIYFCKSAVIICFACLTAPSMYLIKLLLWICQADFIIMQMLILLCLCSKCAKQREAEKFRKYNLLVAMIN